ELVGAVLAQARRGLGAAQPAGEVGAEGGDDLLGVTLPGRRAGRDAGFPCLAHSGHPIAAAAAALSSEQVGSPGGGQRSRTRGGWTGVGRGRWLPRSRRTSRPNTPRG